MHGLAIFTGFAFEFPIHRWCNPRCQGHAGRCRGKKLEDREWIRWTEHLHNLHRLVYQPFPLNTCIAQLSPKPCHIKGGLSVLQGALGDRELLQLHEEKRREEAYACPMTTRQSRPGASKPCCTSVLLQADPCDGRSRDEGRVLVRGNHQTGQQHLQDQ